MNRRAFFQATLVAFGSLAFYPLTAKSEERKRGGAASSSAVTLVDPNDPAAKAVNYVHDNKSIKDVKLQTDRSGVKFKGQKCKACVFYLSDKEAVVGGGKAAPCQMPFAAGKVVSAEGWCTSWAKK